MGQMQRRKRQFRESMRKPGEKVPSRKVAAQMAMSIHFRRSVIVVNAAMELVRARRKIQAIKRSHDGSHNGSHKIEVALITLDAVKSSIARMKQAAEITAP